MLTIITFGIVPGVLPAARAFEYDLDTDGVAEASPIICHFTSVSQSGNGS